MRRAWQPRGARFAGRHAPYPEFLEPHEIAAVREATPEEVAQQQVGDALGDELIAPEQQAEAQPPAGAELASQQPDDQPAVAEPACAEESVMVEQLPKEDLSDEEKAQVAHNQAMLKMVREKSLQATAESLAVEMSMLRHRLAECRGPSPVLQPEGGVAAAPCEDASAEQKPEEEKKCADNVCGVIEAVVGGCTQTEEPGEKISWYEDWKREQEESRREDERRLRAEAAEARLARKQPNESSTPLAESEPSSAAEIVPPRSLGAIPKKPRIIADKMISRDESCDLQQRMDRYLRGSPVRECPLPGIVPIDRQTQPSRMEWDDDAEEKETPLRRLGSERFAAQEVAPMKKKKKSRGYNEKRHLELDDLVSSVRPPSPPSPPPGPPTSQGRRTFVDTPREGRSQPVRRPSEQENQPARIPGANGLPVKLRGVQFGNLLPIPTDPRIDPPPFSCFKCWQKDHAARACRSRVNPRYCTNCGRREVDLNTCPRCSRAHAEFLASRGHAEQQDRRPLRERQPQNGQQQQQPREAAARTPWRPATEAGPSTSRPAPSTTNSTGWDRLRAPAEAAAVEERGRERDRSRRSSPEEQPARAARSASRSRSSVRNRLGPRPADTPEQRDAVLEALSLLDGISDMPPETRQAVLDAVYRSRQDDARR